jgi:hypothetical protein
MLCDLCGREMTKGETHYLYVMGWEKMRKQGGGNALALRKVIHPERYACLPCVQVREKAKPQKEVLFGD